VTYCMLRTKRKCCVVALGVLVFAMTYTGGALAEAGEW
jgi:hypothetical protein